MTRLRAHNLPLVVVEDNEADFEIISLLLRENGLLFPIVHCQTGEEFLAYMEAEQAKSAVERKVPVHILMDLNLPGIGGMELVKRLRSSEVFGAVPVSILTTSSHDKDVAGCYKAGANSYLIKPVDFKRFETIVRAFMTYWFDIVQRAI